MSKPKKPPELKARSGGGVSRRGFIRDVGLGTGAVGVALTPAASVAAAPALSGPGPVAVTLTVNGKQHKLELEPRVTLLDALRNYLDYTGAKRVCDRGTCGACTVLVDGKAVYACSILAIDVQGRNIQTVEGLSLSPEPDPVVRAFVNNDGLQCGFCTPGFVMAAKAFLAENPNPTMEQIRRAFGGNLCRCGSYNGIRRAILEAARSAQGGGKNA